VKIIRVLFGTQPKQDEQNRILARYNKMHSDIEELKKRPYHDFTAITFGDKNTFLANENGFKCCQCWDAPYKYDPLKETYIHKLYAIQFAFEKYGEDVLYLDWDCLPIRPFNDSEFKWNSKITANLQTYRNGGKAYWRKDSNVLLNGGFLHIDNPDIIDGIMRLYEQEKSEGHAVHNDEPILMKWVENHYGWDRAKWEEMFEAKQCRLNRMGVYPNKDAFFVHYIGSLPNRFRR